MKSPKSSSGPCPKSKMSSPNWMVWNYFSTLDLQAGYHHMSLNNTSIPKTAFTSSFGKYQYLKILFWLAQAPVHFQELMNKILKDLPFAIAYLGDIFIYSKTAENHLDYLQQVFHKLWNVKLSMKQNKCNFFAKEIQYVGNILSTTGIKPLPTKTEANRVVQLPKNSKQVWAFLGLVGYYQKFIKYCAHIAKPLMTLMCHNAKFDWTLIHQAAFITLKGVFIQAPIFHYPDPLKCYIAYTDAFDDACGAQLSQEHNGQELPVTFPSHTLMDTQCRWSTLEHEAYAVYYTITKCIYYLQGSNIIVCNDHRPLHKFHNGKEC